MLDSKYFLVFRLYLSLPQQTPIARFEMGITDLFEVISSIMVQGFHKF